MRKLAFIELRPDWVLGAKGERRAIKFDCPEDNGGCGQRHRIPINGHASCSWVLIGEDFNITSISPSIRCSGACRMHITITSGLITFHSDSKSGPDQ